MYVTSIGYAKDRTVWREVNEYFKSWLAGFHDQARPNRVLAGIYKALKRNGSFLMQDIAASSDVEKNIDNPITPFMYSISTMHCMTVSLAQGGMGLGTMWGKEKALEMLSETGFNEVDVKNLAHDFQNNYYIANKKEYRTTESAER